MQHPSADDYTYNVKWSEDDQQFTATCVEFPSLSWVDDKFDEALAGLKTLVADTIADMTKTGSTIPAPNSVR